jgi:hypothetical protein
MSTACAIRKAHPKCRPASSHAPVLRLRDDGRWLRDNGDPSVAFIGLDPSPDGGAIIWVANCKCKVYRDCPVSRALAFAANRYSSATVERRRTSPKLRVKRKKARR